MLVEVGLIQNKLEVVVGSALTIKVSNTEKELSVSQNKSLQINLLSIKIFCFLCRGLGGLYLKLG